MKVNKKLIKDVRTHYLKKYNDIISYLINSMQEEKESNIQLLLDNELHFMDEIKQIKINLAIEEERQEYTSKVDSKISAQEYMLAYLKEQQLLVNEELTRTKASEAYTRKAINTKNRKIANLEERLINLAISITKVEELIKQLLPEKRKVGRPKKIKGELKTDEEENN